MTVGVYGLSPEQCEELWPIIHPFLAAALLKGSPVPETTPEKLLEDLKGGLSQGWMALDGEEPIAFMNTYVAETPVCTRLVIENIAGNDMDSWLPFYESVEEHAREIGVDQIFIRGRPGWARVLKDQGFESQYVALAKTL